jgi:hypothetical protein
MPGEVRWPKAWTMHSRSRPNVLPTLRGRGRVLLLQIGTLASDARGMLRKVRTTQSGGASCIGRSHSARE